MPLRGIDMLGDLFALFRDSSFVVNTVEKGILPSERLIVAHHLGGRSGLRTADT